MLVFITSLVIFLALVIIMAIGVILRNTPIKGSCGGLSALGFKESCMICGGSREQWQHAAAQIGKTTLASEATTHQNT